MSTPLEPVTNERGLLARSIWAQTQAELLLTARRGENVLITVIVPVLLLVFFASLNVVRVGNTNPIDFCCPACSPWP